MTPLLLAPSYQRAAFAKTHRYLPVRYVVAESEAPAYEERQLPVLPCPDAAQGNLCRVRNWILDYAKDQPVLILDDDLDYIGAWFGSTRKKLTGDEAMAMIERGFELADEWGARFWGINCHDDKAFYREHTPFSTVNYIGGPFQAHLRNELRYDVELPLKEDYDMTLAVLNRYRTALRLNWYFYRSDQHQSPGGCAAYRTVEAERSQFLALQRKWGSAIVRPGRPYQFKNRRRIPALDINPTIHVPIKGV